MELSTLTAISPIDGRYARKIVFLRSIFSEFALMKFRIKIEIEWLKKLSRCNMIKDIPVFDNFINNYLNSIILNFNINDAKHIKNIEYLINHDMKAIEYFIKEKINKLSKLKKISEFVHFACTSEDINNLAHAHMLLITKNNVLLPIWKKIINRITFFSKKYSYLPLLSRTHGQPATPSTIGKEMANFVYRMKRQYNQLKNIKILGKINGTVGNYNAHLVAYPNINWINLSKEFVNELGVIWNPYTTQIEPHDYISEIFSCIIRFNTILINFNCDIWRYTSLNHFKLKSLATEIGSSIMPYKVNPIDFENSEGNLGLSNAILNYFSMKLPISRWQRDLSDSTILRSMGSGIGYAVIAYHSLMNGISKLQVNKDNLLIELNNNWKVLTEPIQTVMRKYGIKNSYEEVKKFIQNKNSISNKEIYSFIDNLSLPEEEKLRLKKLTPNNYIGYASKMINICKI